MNMKHDLEKNYFEYLAKLVLEATMPDTYQNIQLQDKPDLLTGNNEGIEVTRLFFKNAGKSAGFFDKIKEKNISELDPKSVERFEKLGNKLIYYKGKVAAYIPEAVWVYPELLQRAYREKLLKLQHYKPCAANSLFVFSTVFDYYEERDIKEFAIWAEQESLQYIRKFSTVFVFEYTALYICDVKSACAKTITLDHDTVTSWCAKAKEFAMR